MLGRTAKAIMMLLTSALFLCGVAVAVDRAELVSLYKHRFDFHPGSWVGERIAEVAQAKNACLIVGASTARQGFDPAILEQGLPRIQFLNAGTTGAAIEVLEIESQIISRYGLKFRCIIAAIHPWLIKNVGLPELVNTEYVSQLRATDVLSFSHYWWPSGEWRMLVSAYLFPLKKHAPQLNKMMRVSLSGLRRALLDDSLPLAAFEYYSGELAPAPDFGYPGNPNYLRESYQSYVDTLTSLHWYDQNLYLQKQSIASFRRSLSLLVEHADTVIVINMPDTSIWNEPNKWAKSRYESLIRDFRNVAYVDCQFALRNTEFVDHAHPNDDGRRKLSNWLAAYLKSMWAGESKPGCSVK